MKKALLLIPALLADSRPARFFWLLRRGLLATYYRAYLRQLVHHRPMFDHRQPPVIVYTMGHVGSSSVYKTLSQVSPGINLFRITGLSDSYLHSALERLGGIHDSGDRQHAQLLVERLARLDYLRQRVRSEKTRFKLVTLVRLPVVRSISRAFYEKRGRDISSGPHHQDSGEAKIRESTAGVSSKPSSDGKACGCSSKHLCGLTAWNT